MANGRDKSTSKRSGRKSNVSNENVADNSAAPPDDTVPNVPEVDINTMGQSVPQETLIEQQAAILAEVTPPSEHSMPPTPTCG